MAVVNLKSQQLTDMDAVPHVAVNSYQATGQLRDSVGSIAVTSGDSIASTYRLARVPSNARMSSLTLATTAITTCAGDVGLYRTTDDGGLVVDADFFGAAQTLAAASAGLNVIGGNIITPINRTRRLWDLIGLTADPVTYYDIVITLTAAAGSAGSVAVDAAFVV